MPRAVEFKSPVLRLVQGDCFEAQTKDKSGAPLLVKKGPNAGKPTIKFFIAAAGLKGDPAVEALKAAIEAHCRSEWPEFYNGVTPTRTMYTKVMDGDGMDDDGKQNALKEGFAGHWVFKFGSSFAPKCYAAGKYAPTDQLSTVGPGGAKMPNPIPRGYKIRVAGTMQGNGDTSKPGLYLNFSLVELAMIGDIIVSGPNAAEVFGGGAASAPAAAGGLIMTAAANGVTYEAYKANNWSDDQLIAGGLAVRPAAAPAAPPPPAAAPMAPPPPAAAPAAPAAPPPPPAPVAVAPHPAILTGPQMTAAAGAVSYAQYKAQGWSDDQLIAGGLMLAPVAAAPAAPAPLAPVGSVAPPPPPAPIAPAAPGKVMTALANGVTYEAYIANNWTDAMLIQNGFMLA